MGAACCKYRPTAAEDDQVPDLASDGGGTTPNGPSAAEPNGYDAPGKQAAPSRTVSAAGSVYFDANDGEWHSSGEQMEHAPSHTDWDGDAACYGLGHECKGISLCRMRELRRSATLCETCPIS